ncbi:hypothetical protein C8Q73DRAFT_130420 [Cubamyces lactineus]|nr:hypothetical protein C8Q73DRAFT_130420 [Cubamyces lactineus]
MLKNVPPRLRAGKLRRPSRHVRRWKFRSPDSRLETPYIGPEISQANRGVQMQVAAERSSSSVCIHAYCYGNTFERACVLIWVTVALYSSGEPGTITARHRSGVAPKGRKDQPLSTSTMRRRCGARGRCQACGGGQHKDVTGRPWRASKTISGRRYRVGALAFTTRIGRGACSLLQIHLTHTVAPPPREPAHASLEDSPPEGSPVAPLRQGYDHVYGDTPAAAHDDRDANRPRR